MHEEGSARARHSWVSPRSSPSSHSFDRNSGASSLRLKMRFAYVRACKLTLSARRQRISDVCKQPAPSRDRPPTLSQTVRGSQPAPTAASRRSKIGPFDRPRRYVSKHDCDRIPEVCEKTTPSRDRPPTLSQTVRGSQPTPSMVENRPRRPPAPTCVQA